MEKIMKKSLAFAILTLIAAPFASAQTVTPAAPAPPEAAAPVMPMPPGMPMAHGMPMSPTVSIALGQSPSTAAYQASMAKMDKGMDVPYTGYADADFVAGMIPHHQGAIDMAEIELKYGHDQKIRDLAARIVASQTHEIGVMQKWQTAQKSAAKTPPKK